MDSAFDLLLSFVNRNNGIGIGRGAALIVITSLPESGQGMILVHEQFVRHDLLNAARVVGEVMLDLDDPSAIERTGLV